MPADDILLETRGLTVRYGGVLAVDDASLRVSKGRITGLIGPNGAGKTSLVDAVTGFTPSSGEVLLGGAPAHRWPAHRRSRAGLARTWQSLELFDDLTVAQNVLVAARRLTVGSVFADLWRPRRSAAEPAVATALDRVGLGDVADRRPGELPLGRRKLLGVARALAAGPQVLLLDEPAAGLDTGESEELGRRLRGIADQGTGILLIDHDMGLVLDVCDDVYVLEFGRVIAHGTPAEIRADEQVVAAYLGDSAKPHNTEVAEGAVEGPRPAAEAAGRQKEGHR
ncbi:ABC transporter ATP-binding protein [Streptomyces sp. NPDC047085]|uniref:ABC transporter ATP-binding protein n=1 Tax=Streptomyces sp. NPDC047085 TaxID=3155140 RepID=UPI003405C064